MGCSSVTLRVCALALALLLAGASSIPQAASRVTLSYGTFQGAQTGNVTRFLGIPFAKPPVGQLRFSPPQPPLPLHGIQDASSFGAACLQQELIFPDVLPFSISPPSGPPSNQSEDCLNLNVWVPAGVHQRPLPVLVWIYGGAYETGATSTTYDATSIVERSIVVREPVIVVSANYRLNAFGFLGGREIEKAGLGNVGFLDQRFALKWIQRYISSFGGDPTKVTIWGQSAGAESVLLHMTYGNGDTEGLYRGAFMQSAAPPEMEPLSDGQPAYDYLVSKTGCSHHPDTLACLRSISSSALLAAVHTVPEVFNYTSLNLHFQPRYDGVTILRNVFQSIKEQKYAKVPFIASNCEDEGTVFSLPNINVTTNTEFMNYIHNNYLKGASQSDILAVSHAYPEDPSQGAPYNTGNNYTLSPEYKRIASFTGDWVFQAPRRYLLEVASATQKTWSYLYTRGHSTPFIGATHGVDLGEAFSFGGVTQPNDFIGTDALINFVTNLDPNYAPITPRNTSYLEHIQWPRWTSSSRKLLTYIDPAPSLTITLDNYRAAPMKLLNNIALSLSN